MSSYAETRERLETYFDRTAAKTWEALTSDAPVSKIRQTVREGRDEMRMAMLSSLPDDLTGARVLDAGAGAGQMTEALAMRGAIFIPKCGPRPTSSLLTRRAMRPRPPNRSEHGCENHGIAFCTQAFCADAESGWHCAGQRRHRVALSRP